MKMFIAVIMRRAPESLRRTLFPPITRSLSRYGLESDVEAINHAGVQIARAAVGSDAYVVGAVGSIRGG